MQGRLSQKDNQSLQSFPNRWEDEFKRAKDIGFKKIEWLVDKFNNKNPLFSEDGRKKITEISNRNEIKIDTLCAHFLINGEIINNTLESDIVRNYLMETIKLAPLIGVKYLSIPCIENMSLKDNNVLAKIKNLFNEILNESKIEIIIESDLSSYELLNFIESIGSTKIGILYDTGNATRNKLLFKNEFPLIANYIKEIHIKDFDLKSKKSVRLGRGHTDFKDIFKHIKKYNWEGPLVLETPVFKDWEKEANFNLSYMLKISQSL